MSKSTKIQIQTETAPQAIGIYSQAIKNGNTVYLSGQIGIDPKTGQLFETFEEQTHQVFKNLKAVCEASGGKLDDAVKVTIFVTDMTNFSKVNEIMQQYFEVPYPARSTVGVSMLPRGAMVEADVTLCLD